MALVIFFVPEPAKAVAEMARVVRPGGLVAAYAWDFPGGGFPFDPVQQELRALGFTPPLPPHAEASRAEALRALWGARGSRRWRRARSPCSAISRASTRFGSLPGAPPACARCSRR
jgi:SAM-dependent methyltransferase